MLMPRSEKPIVPINLNFSPASTQLGISSFFTFMRLVLDQNCLLQDLSRSLNPTSPSPLSPFTRIQRYFVKLKFLRDINRISLSPFSDSSSSYRRKFSARPDLPYGCGFWAQQPALLTDLQSAIVRRLGGGSAH